MSDVNIDDINIEIAASAQDAAAPIESLANAVSRLKKSTAGATGLTQLVNELNGLKGLALFSLSEDLNLFAESAANLSAAISGLSGMSALRDLADGLSSISSVDTSTIANNMGGIATAAAQLESSLPEIPRITALGAALSGISPALQSMNFHFNQTTPAASRATSGVSSFKSVMSGFNTVLHKVGAPLSFLSKLIKNIGSDSRKSSKSVNIFGSNIIKAFGRIMMYRAIRTVLHTISSGFIEGIKNISAFSTATSTAMQSLQTDALYLKNSLGALAEPIIQILAPAFQILVEYIVQAVNAIGMFIAALSGASTYIKAKRALTDIEKAAGGAAKAIQSVTLGFDELHAIPEKAGGLDVSGMFEEVGIPDWIKNLDAYGTGKAIADWLANGLANIDWEKIRQRAREIAETIADFINGFIDTPQLWYQIGRAIGEGLNTAFDFAEAFAERLKWHKLGQMLAYGLNTAIEFWDSELAGRAVYKNLNGIMDTIHTFFVETNWGELGRKFAVGFNTIFEGLDSTLLGQTFASRWNALIDVLYGFVTTFKWTQFGEKISDAINGWFAEIKWSKAGKAISDGFDGALATINTVLKETKWDDIGEDIATFLKEIDWAKKMEGVGEVIGNAFVAAVKLAWPTLKDILWAIIVEPFTSMPEQFQAQMDAAGENVVAGFFKGIWSAITKPGWIIDNLFAPFMAGLQDAFQMHSPSKVMEEMGVYIIEGLFNGLTGLWDKVSGIFTEALEGIKSTFSFESLKSIGSNAVEGMMNGLKSIGSKAKEWGVEILGNIKDALGIHSPSTETTDMGINLMQGLDNGVQANAAIIVQAFMNMWTSVMETAQTALIQFQEIWGVIPAWFADNVNSHISLSFEEMWNNINENSSNSWDSIMKTWSATVGWFKTEIIDPLKINFTSFGDWLVGLFTSITSQIQSVFQKMVNQIESEINRLERRVASLRSSVSSLKSSISSLSSSVSSLSSSVSRSSSTSSSSAKIQGYAIGGILPRSADVFLANENGIPEMIGSYGNQTAVANQGQLVDGISAGVAEGMEGANQGVINALYDVLDAIVNKPLLSDTDIANANFTGSSKGGIRMNRSPAFNY